MKFLIVLGTFSKIAQKVAFVVFNLQKFLWLHSFENSYSLFGISTMKYDEICTILKICLWNRVFRGRVAISSLDEFAQ